MVRVSLELQRLPPTTQPVKVGTARLLWRCRLSGGATVLALKPLRFDIAVE